MATVQQRTARGGFGANGSFGEALGLIETKGLVGMIEATDASIEAAFKAFGRALRVACSKDKQLGRMLPSTKGLL